MEEKPVEGKGVEDSGLRPRSPAARDWEDLRADYAAVLEECGVQSIRQVIDGFLVCRRLMPAIRDIIEWDQISDFGALCDTDNGYQQQCEPAQSDRLRSALHCVREIIGEIDRYPASLQASASKPPQPE